MAWLSQWLKEIIMVILLAAFIDLLLPNRTMQRYVKLMMSLIILLILLSPVIKLFDAKLADELEAEWQKAAAESPAVYDTLTSIQREASRLTAARNEEVMKVAASQLSANMKDKLRESLLQLQDRDAAGMTSNDSVPVMQSADAYADVYSVAVKLGQSSTGEPQVNSVHVVLVWQSASEQNSTTEAMTPNAEDSPSNIKPIETVQDVKITAGSHTYQPVSKNNDAEQAQAGSQSPASQDNPNARAVEQARKQSAEATVIKQLTTQWLVRNEQVEVEWQK